MKGEELEKRRIFGVFETNLRTWAAAPSETGVPARIPRCRRPWRRRCFRPSDRGRRGPGNRPVCQVTRPSPSRSTGPGQLGSSCTWMGRRVNPLGLLKSGKGKRGLESDRKATRYQQVLPPSWSQSFLSPSRRPWGLGPTRRASALGEASRHVCRAKLMDDPDPELQSGQSPWPLSGL